LDEDKSLTSQTAPDIYSFPLPSELGMIGTSTAYHQALAMVLSRLNHFGPGKQQEDLPFNSMPIYQVVANRNGKAPSVTIQFRRTVCGMLIDRNYSNHFLYFPLSPVTPFGLREVIHT
jgi:hypothetical protein